MKFVRVAAVVVILATMAGVSAFAEYDRNAVVQVMRNNVQLMRQVRSASNENDFYLAAQKLMELANGMIGIIKFTPRRGEKTAWDDTMDQFVSAAFQGIGACGEKDKQKLDQAIARLQELNRAGHSQFK